MNVTFRKVTEKDLKRMREIVNDEDVSLFLGVIPPVSMKSTQGFYEDRNQWNAVVVEGEICGSINILPKRRKSKQSHVASFGISLAKEYWGLGVGDKSMKYMLKKTGEMKSKRIELEVVAENKRARRLYTKHGFRNEGTKKKSFKIKGRYHDTVMMAKWLN